MTDAVASIRLWPLAIAHFFGVTALFAHVALTSVLTKSWIDSSDGQIAGGLATLPLSMLILFSALAIAPAGRLMQRFGYRIIFVAGTLLGAISGGLCVLAVVCHDNNSVSPSNSLLFFSLAIVPQGCAYGVVHFYRHAAAIVGRLTAPPGSSTQQQTARAVAVVITSGALAGVAGPGIADLTESMIARYPFAGTYAILILVSLLHTVVLFFTNVDAAFAAIAALPPPPSAVVVVPPAPPNEPLNAVSASAEEKVALLPQQVLSPSLALPSPLSKKADPPRALWTIVTQKDYLVAMLTATGAHGLMLVLMSITPLLLHHRVNFSYSSLVIQVHVLCMYLPSFGTSKIIARFGANRVAMFGLVVSCAGAALMYVPQTTAVWGYYGAVMASLALVGLGWNFTYVSATTSVAGCYAAEERFKAQSFNDVTVFTIGACLTLGSGSLLANLGISHVALGCIILYVVVFALNVVVYLQRHRCS